MAMQYLNNAVDTTIRIAVISAGLAALSTSALACSCMRGDDDQIAKSLRAILAEPGSFMAEAVAQDSSGGGQQQTTIFKITETWVGSPSGPSISVSHNTSSAACGMTFKTGQSVMLLSISGHINLCMQMMATRASVWGKARVKALIEK